ncbi:MAG: hypothetical protein KKH04_12195 [Proteobacteria bacterium]|nr:hypothetical protein [Pseudomonadota bacterium]
MAKRRKVPAEIEEAVLTKSARRCVLCFGLSNDRSQKRGQIAHIDGNAENSQETNLAFLCLEHHDWYDSRSSQSRGITPAELREYQARLHTWVAGGMVDEPVTSCPDREQLALEEILGRIGPRVLTIMNVASAPRDLLALREEMRVYHERLDELAALFMSEPATRDAILDIGQLGGGAVSLSPQVPLGMFERFTTAKRTVEGALVKRQRPDRPN